MLGLFSRKKKPSDRLRLIGTPDDIDTCKCLYLIAEKGMSVDYDMADRSNAQQLEGRSAVSSLPGLATGEQTYSGISAVLPYLDIKGGGQSLVPRKAARLGDQNYWIEVGQLKVLAPLNLLLQDSIQGDAQADQQALEQARQQLDDVFTVADQHLADKYYFAGNFSLADVHWMSYLHFCGICGEMDLVDKYGHLKQWFVRNQSRKTANKSTYLAFPDPDQVKGKTLQNVA